MVIFGGLFLLLFVCLFMLGVKFLARIFELRIWQAFFFSKWLQEMGHPGLIFFKKIYFTIYSAYP